MPTQPERWTKFVVIQEQDDIGNPEFILKDTISRKINTTEITAIDDHDTIIPSMENIFEWMLHSMGFHKNLNVVILSDDDMDGYGIPR